MSRVHPTCCYWLACEETDGRIALVDGCHGSPEGVAKAAKLHSRIFGNEGPWLMVEINAVPDLDPPINEQSAAECRALLAGSKRTEKPHPRKCHCPACLAAATRTEKPHPRKCHCPACLAAATRTSGQPTNDRPDTP